MEVQRMMKKVIRSLVGADLRNKEEHELDWQRNWARLYAQPGAKEKCLEYWRSHRFLDEIRSRIPLEGKRILDVGCGINTVLEFLPGRRIGVDPLAEDYKRIHQYPPDVEIRESKGESLPFADASFDVVFCSNVIDHTEDPDKVISEVTRVLTSRGHFILTVESFSEEAADHFRNVGHPHNITLDRLHGLVAGFELLIERESPWVGIRRYVEGRPPTKRMEQILLLRKAA